MPTGSKRERRFNMIRFKTKHIIAIIVAILAFIGVLIPILIQQCNKKPEEPKELNLVITLQDADTGERIAGYVYINYAELGTFIDSVETPPNIPLVKGSYNIRVVSKGYVDVDRTIAHNGKPIGIQMRRMQQIIEPDDNTQTNKPIPLPISNWYPYKGITSTIGASNNECILNSIGILPESAGIVNEHLGTSLRGKTLILFFSNTSISRFNGGLMIKVEADNQVIQPPSYTFPINGYLPVGDTPANNGIEYLIPDSFNGKLEFIFYQAELNNLHITAYYKE
jgi:hypothetical protein